MARRREPKTVEEVVAFVEGILPEGWSVMVYVTFHARHEYGRRSSSHEYSLHFWPNGHHDHGFDVKASSPADVARLAVRQIAERQRPREIEPPTRRALPPPKRRRELTTREFFHLDPPRQITFQGGA